MGKSVLRRHNLAADRLYCLDFPPDDSQVAGAGGELGDLAAAAYACPCTCGLGRAGSGGRVGAREPGQQVVIALMWLGGDQGVPFPSQPSAEKLGSAQGLGRSPRHQVASPSAPHAPHSRGWRERLCRFLLRRQQADADAASAASGVHSGVQGLRSVCLGPSCARPSPQASVSQLQHFSYHGVLAPAVRALFSALPEPTAAQFAAVGQTSGAGGLAAEAEWQRLAGGDERGREFAQFVCSLPGIL